STTRSLSKTRPRKSSRASARSARKRKAAAPGSWRRWSGSRGRSSTHGIPEPYKIAPSRREGTVRRMLRWVAWPIGVLAAALVVATIATARFGDKSLYPPSADGLRVEVFVAANLYHSGIVVPREALAEVARRRALPALESVTARFAAYDRLEFG